VSITVTVNGQSGLNIAATSGDQVGVSVAPGSSSYAVSVSPAGTPGGQGIQGPQGPPSTTITVGQVSTLAPGSNATVTSSSSNSGANLTLNFGLPAGQTGAAGATGANGITPTFSASATTLSAGSDATVTATTSNGGSNVALAFGIPAGATGGGSNLTLSDATPSNLGTASAGSSNLAARADHVHTLPSLSTLGAAAAAHNHPYVTSLNNLTGGLTLAAGGNVTITSANSTLTIAASGGLGENDAVDGGNYVGEILGGITFSVQPQSQTASTSYSFGNWAASQATFSPDANNSTIQPVGGVVSLGSTLYTIAYGSASKTQLYKSANSGSSWSVAAQETNVTRYTTPTAESTQLAGNGTHALIAIYEGPFYLTTNAGQNWSAVGDYSGQPLRRYMTYGAGLWVMILPGATASSTAYLSSSSDGTNWTDRTIPAGVYSGVAFGNGLFVAPRGTHAAISSDGITWSSVSLPSIGSGQSTGGIAFGNGMFVVSASSGDGSVIRIFRSTDGSTWTSHAVNFVSAAITYAAGLFAATAPTSSTDVWTSGNGTSWTLGVLPASDAWKPVTALSSTLLTTRSVATSGDNYILRLASASVTAVNGSASFTATASVSSGQTISYQWQLSTDAGSNWTNISGATTSTLSLSGLTTADSGKRYRVSASATGATTVNSQAAILTVS
jgi:hypothetical protein